MEKKTIWLLVLVVIIVVIPAIVVFIYGSLSGKHSSDQKPPEYSFMNAVATNVSITGNTTSKIFTADFNFTVIAYNPNKNHTLYYGGGEATASFHRKLYIKDVLASAVTMPPALPLLPRASALFTYNLRAQGVALGEDSSYLFSELENTGTGSYVETMLTVNVTAWFDNENSTSPSSRPLVVQCVGVGFVDSTYQLKMYDPFCQSSF